jgi:hypothetical protein
MLEFYFEVFLNMLEFYFKVLLNMLEFYFEILLNMLEFYFEVLLNMLEFYFEVLLNMLEFYFEVLLNMLEFASDACCYFFNIIPVMLSKHSELAKKQTQDRYGRFTSPSSHISVPPSGQEVESCSRCRTAPPPSRMQEVKSSSRR